MQRKPRDAIVDADACARAGSLIERSFSAADLPRLREAGAAPRSTIAARFQFSTFAGKPVIEGELTGEIESTCQRCMKAVSLALNERFQVLVAPEERADEPGGYEPIVADPSHLDLRWLADEEALLALPLVAMHEAEDCAQAAAASSGEQEEHVRQRPFQNLRDMLRER